MKHTDAVPRGPEPSPDAGGSGGSAGSAGSSEAPHRTADPGFGRDEEPDTRGTLFIMLLFLMALAGMWGIMYVILLGR